MNYVKARFSNRTCFLKRVFANKPPRGFLNMAPSITMANHEYMLEDRKLGRQSAVLSEYVNTDKHSRRNSAIRV